LSPASHIELSLNASRVAAINDIRRDPISSILSFSLAEWRNATGAQRVAYRPKLPRGGVLRKTSFMMGNVGLVLLDLRPSFITASQTNRNQGDDR